MSDCDCVPGHRCDCWDYRTAPVQTAAATLHRELGHIVVNWRDCGESPCSVLAALPVREDEPTGIDATDVRRLYAALVRTWPRTYGNRSSWAQPSIEMAAAVAAEYDRLTREASHVR